MTILPDPLLCSVIVSFAVFEICIGITRLLASLEEPLTGGYFMLLMGDGSRQFTHMFCRSKRFRVVADAFDRINKYPATLMSVFTPI